MMKSTGKNVKAEAAKTGGKNAKAEAPSAGGKNAKGNASTANAPVKPASAKETAAAAQSAKAAATVAATPTRDVQSAGKNANKGGKNDNANTESAATPTPAKNVNTKPNAKEKAAATATPAKNANAANKPKSASAKGNANTTKGNKSKLTMGVGFLLQLVLRLAPEKRANCQILREILVHETNKRLVLTPTIKGLHPAPNSDSDDWASIDQNLLRQMVRNAQSDTFQETMMQLRGEHMYDHIRSQLKQAGGAWEITKDRPSLQPENLRPRSDVGSNIVKPQKAPKQAPAKVNAKEPVAQVQSVKMTGGVRSAPGVAPPPAPVAAKASSTKKEIAPANKKQEKAAAPEKSAKNANPAKNATPAKGANPAKNASATIAQNKPGSISGGARGGRATISSK